MTHRSFRILALRAALSAATGTALLLGSAAASPAQAAPAAAAAALEFVSAPPPTVERPNGGAVRDGATVFADPGEWTPAPEGIAYQWLRDGSAILGAVGPLYTPSVSDEGAMLSVRTTAYKSGYSVTSRVSVGEQVLPRDTGSRAFTTSGVPSLLGSPQLGARVAASPGLWSPVPDAFSYRWERNGLLIPGATSSTYVPTAADEGGHLSVWVIASRSGHVTTVRSSGGSLVLPATPVLADFTAAPAPSIPGAAQVGVAVRAVPGEWSPEPASLSYQWLRDGGRIPGAVTARYTPEEFDEGRALSVRVTATLGGHTTTARYSAAQTVRPADAEPLDFALAPEPIVTGAARVGSSLSAVSGLWSPAPDSQIYQWFRDGRPISGATSASYTPMPVDAGTRLSVRLTTDLAGYRTTARTSATHLILPRFDPPKRLTATPKPKIGVVGGGKAKVGKKLTVKAGTWKPAKVTLKYRWLRNGRAITGATKSRYKITKKDRGKRISVRVTGLKTGYVISARTSASKHVAKAR